MFNLFNQNSGKQQQQPQQQQQPPQQQQQPPVPSGGQQQLQQPQTGWGQQPQQPPQQQQQPSSSAPASPLDAFVDLWEAPKQQQPKSTSVFNIDQGKLSESLKKMDFSKAMSPELVTKALGGDQQAFGQAMNSVAQAVFGNMTQLTTHLIEQALSKHGSGMEEKFNEQIRQFRSSEVLSKNPLFNHPASRPLVEALKTQFAQKFPEATPEDIAQQASEYLDGIVQLVKGGEQPNPDAQKKTGQIDWEQFLNG